MSSSDAFFFPLFYFRRRNRNSCALSCFASLFRNKYSPDTLPYIFSYSHDKLASLRLRILPEAADPSQPFYADIPMYTPSRALYYTDYSSSFIVIDIFILSFVAVVVFAIAYGKGEEIFPRSPA